MGGERPPASPLAEYAEKGLRVETKYAFSPGEFSETLAAFRDSLTDIASYGEGSTEGPDLGHDAVGWCRGRSSKGSTWARVRSCSMDEEA